MNSIVDAVCHPQLSLIRSQRYAMARTLEFFRGLHLISLDDHPVEDQSCLQITYFKSDEAVDVCEHLTRAAVNGERAQVVRERPDFAHNLA